MYDSQQPPQQPPSNIKSEEHKAWMPPTSQEAMRYFDYYLLLLQMKAELSGGQLTETKTGYTILKATYPFMNETGVEETMAFIRGLVHIISGMSIYTEERIMDVCLRISIDLNDYFYINMERFELNNSSFRLVKRIIMENIEANLRKSINGESMHLIGQSEKVSIQRVEQPRKWFGLF